MIRRLLALALLLPSLAFADHESVITADAPCHWYKMQETSGVTLSDTAIAGGCGADNLTMVGSPSLNQSSTGVIGKKSVKMDGTTQYARYVEAFGGCSLSLSAGDWSWEAWGLVHGTDADGAAFGALLASYGAMKPGWVMYIKQIAATPKAQFTGFNTLGATYVTVSSTTSGASLDTWYYVAATWKLSTTTLTIYLNGVSEASSSSTTGTAGCGENVDVGDINGTVLLNGNEQYPAIYNGTLSSATILSHYNAGLGISATSAGMPFSVKRDRLRPNRFDFARPVAFVDAPGFIVDKLNRAFNKVPSVYAESR